MLLSLFFFFLIIDLYFLVVAAITQVFNPIAELVIPSKEAKEWIEMHPLIGKPEIRKCSV